MNRIIEIRQKLKMSRKEFANALSITVGAISNYENGSRAPKLVIAYRILELAAQKGLGLNLEDIYMPSIAVEEYA